MKSCSLILGLALLLGASGSALAGGKAAKDRLNIPPGKQLKHEMSLTPAQRRELERVRRESLSESRKLQKQINQLRTELDGLYQEYSLNLDRVKAVHQSINAAQAQLLESHLKAQKRVRSILNSQEFASLQESLRTADAPTTHPPAPASNR